MSQGKEQWLFLLECPQPINHLPELLPVKSLGQLTASHELLSKIATKTPNQRDLKCIVTGFPKLWVTSYVRWFYLQHGRYIFLVILNISDYTKEKNLNLIFNNYLPPASLPLSLPPTLSSSLLLLFVSADCRLRTLRWHNTSYYIIFLWLLSIYGE